MQTDAAAEKSDRLRTPISTSSSSSILTLVRSGSSTTTQEPPMKNGMSHTPKTDIPSSSSGKISREGSLPATNASESKKKHVFPKDNDGLSDKIEDESSEEDLKRKRRSRAALDNSFDLSDEDNLQQTSTKITRGETNNSLEKNANDKSRIRTPNSARKKQSPPRKKGKLTYDDEYTYTTTSSSKSRVSTPKVDKISGKLDGNQDAHLPYNEAATGNIPLSLYAKLAPPRHK
jgi:hypothetical protein